MIMNKLKFSLQGKNYIITLCKGKYNLISNEIEIQVTFITVCNALRYPTIILLCTKNKLSLDHSVTNR